MLYPSFSTRMRRVHFTHFVTQCAAVRTHCVPINAPPHRYWLRELIKATCQHHSLASASSPPTTRAVLLELRAWIGPRDVPFTPQTYLLYTGLLVVLVIVVVSSVKWTIWYFTVWKNAKFGLLVGATSLVDLYSMFCEKLSSAQLSSASLERGAIWHCIRN